MKRLLPLLLLAALCVILFTGMYIYAATPGNAVSESKLNRYKAEALANNPYHPDSPDKEEYAALCAEETKKGIYFPGKAAYALLHYENYFKSSKKLTDNQMKQLLTILNDSASYEWGELGTPQVYYYFTFHNQDEKCIGVTTIDLQGQAYATPSLHRMKWNLLKNIEPIEDIIEDITHK